MYKLFVLETWWKHAHYSDVCDLFRERFSNVQPPSRQGFNKLNVRFEKN